MPVNPLAEAGPDDEQQLATPDQVRAGASNPPAAEARRLLHPEPEMVTVPPLEGDPVADEDPEVTSAADAPLRVHRLDPDLPLPRRAHPTDAGIDLHTTSTVRLRPGERALVGTGIAVALPAGTVGLVHPRSGLAAKHGVSIVNAPGTIDADYRGEIKVCLINLDPRATAVLTRGDRIAQLLVQKVSLCDVVEVTDPAELGDTVRGTGGHGSTGL